MTAENTQEIPLRDGPDHRSRTLPKRISPSPFSARSGGVIVVGCSELLEPRRFLSAAPILVATFGHKTGEYPQNLVVDSRGDLFGTTTGGANGTPSPTVFEVPVGTGKIVTLASFDASTVGKPVSLVIDPGGNLIGTLAGNRSVSHPPNGSIFEISGASHILRTIADFPPSAFPDSGELVGAPDGDLYGSDNDGGLFEWNSKSQELFTFPASDEINLAGGLAVDGTGDLFFANVAGAPLEEITSGSQTPIDANPPGLDGGFVGLQTDAAGNIYFLDGFPSDLEVYERTAGGSYINLAQHAFQLPLATTLAIDDQGNIFTGTWATSSLAHEGSIVEIPRGSQTDATVATFSDDTGAYPAGSLIAGPGGVLYGTTADADPYNVNPAPSPGSLPDGAIFAVTGSGYIPSSSSAPLTIVQPSNVDSLGGSTASFTAAAAGYPTPTIQWQFSTDGGRSFTNVTENSSATAPTLTLSNLSANQNGTAYRAVFTNALGTAVSSAAKLAVLPIAFVAPAHASPNMVTITSTVLAAQGETSAGESDLTYTWRTVAAPSGALHPTFSANGTAAANHLTATFGKAGYYRFRCSISDGLGHTLATDVSVNVEQTATSLRLTPHHKTIQFGQTLQYHAALYDQFGHPVRTQPAVTYSILSGPGTIDQSTGLFTASLPGAVLIEAEEGDFSGTVGLQVIP